jgi:hypothetical protein
VAAQYATNGLSGETPAHQESYLARTLGSSFFFFTGFAIIVAKLPLPDLPRTRQFINFTR